MYNSDLPTRAQLPSSTQLLRSTVMAIAAAAVILVTIVLPAEYGIDPTRIGRALGLTRMGEIKMARALDAEADRAAAPSPGQPAPGQGAGASPQSPAPPEQRVSIAPAEPANAKPAARTDETIVTLKPGEGAEVKMEMSKGATVRYEWAAAGGPVNHDTHVDDPKGGTHSYSKGRRVERDAGEITAVFDGHHGWFWRNRGNNAVTIALKTSGEYRSIKRM